MLISMNCHKKFKRKMEAKSDFMVFATSLRYERMFISNNAYDIE